MYLPEMFRDSHRDSTLEINLKYDGFVDKTWGNKGEGIQIMELCFEL